MPNPKSLHGVEVLASRLKLLNFQGITVSGDRLIVATLEADLLHIDLLGNNRELTLQTNVSRFGIPNGIAARSGKIIVAVSAQELGDFLLEVNDAGKVKVLADLSKFTGAFGTPFDVTIHRNYFYMVAISTDVIASRGSLLQVTPQGNITEIAQLSSSPFGLANDLDRWLVALEDGEIVAIYPNGKVRSLTCLAQDIWGIPLSITHYSKGWLISTTTGWLLKLNSDFSVSELINFKQAGYGNPAALATYINNCLVTTTLGYILKVNLAEI